MFHGSDSLSPQDHRSPPGLDTATNAAAPGLRTGGEHTPVANAAIENKVKGVAFRATMRALADVRGDDALNRSIARCRREVRDALRYQQVVVGGWYPISWYRELLAAIVEGEGGRKGIARELGRRGIELDLNGVYRTLFKLMKPGTLVSFFKLLFPRYYAHGRLTVEAESKGFLRVAVRDCRGFDHLMYLDLLGATERMIELTGVKNPRCRITSGGADHGETVVMEGTWG